MLATQSFGSDTSLPPILIAHGLFGSGRNWGVIAKRLSEVRRVLTVDMRNHGESFWADSNTYEDMAEDLATVIAAHGGVADVLGHSMGGKAAMVLALTQPDALRRLLIADIAPVSYTHGAGHLDLIAAMQALDLTTVETRGDADRALTAAIPSPSVRAFLLQSLDVKEKRWRLNLDVLARTLPNILAFPDVPGPFPGPTLFLAGGKSHYIQPEYRTRIRNLFPAAKQATLPDTGHWLHAEKPRDFEATALVFLGEG